MGITSLHGLYSTAGSGFDYRTLMDLLKGESNVKIDSSVKLGLKRYVKGQLKKHGDWGIHPVFEEL